MLEALLDVAAIAAAGTLTFCLLATAVAWHLRRRAHRRVICPESGVETEIRVSWRSESPLDELRPPRNVQVESCLLREGRRCAAACLSDEEDAPEVCDLAHGRVN